MNAPIRRRLFSTGNPQLDRQIGELARDTDDALTGLVSTSIVKLTDVYIEPLRVTFAHEPEGVLLLRVREDASPETEVATYSTMPFVYRNGAVEITAVEGCVVGTRYRFAFWMVG